jgi:hypothetical protein
VAGASGAARVAESAHGHVADAAALARAARVPDATQADVAYEALLDLSVRRDGGPTEGPPSNLPQAIIP